MDVQKHCVVVKSVLFSIVLVELLLSLYSVFTFYLVFVLSLIRVAHQVFSSPHRVLFIGTW